MNWPGLIAALIAYETSQHPARVGTVPDGDGGQAHGCLQIHQCVLDDVNRLRGTEYTLEQVQTSKASAQVVCLIYLEHYLNVARRHHATATKGMSDLEIAARIWNGGPNGWSKPDTLNYWQHIKHLLNNG